MYPSLSDFSDNASVVSSFSDIHIQAAKEDSTRSWVLCSLAFTLFLLIGGFFTATGLFIQPMADDLELSTSFISFMFSSIFGFILIFGLPAGLLADGFGYAKVIGSGGILILAGLFSTGFCTEVWQMFIAFSMVTGLGISLTMLPIVCLLSHYFNHYQAVALGLSVSGWGIGTLIFGAFNEWLLYNITWNYIIMLFGIIISVWVLICSVLFRSRKTHKVEDIPRSVTPYFKNNILYRYIIGTFIIGIGILIPWLHLVPYAEKLDIERDQALYIISMLGVSNAIGRIVIPYIPMKIPIPLIRLMRACLLLIGISTPLWYLCKELWSIMIYSAFYGFLSGSLVSILPAVIENHFPSKACLGIITGVISTSTGIGMMFGIGLSYYLVDEHGNFLAPILLSSFFIIVGFIVLFTIPTTVVWATANESDFEGQIEMTWEGPEKKWYQKIFNV